MYLPPVGEHVARSPAEARGGLRASLGPRTPALSQAGVKLPWKPGGSA
jgi:hypothetical protein